MVNHDHNRIKSRGDREIGDEVDRKLFERERDSGQNWTERGNGGMSVNFVLLADCTTSNKMFDTCGQAWPPEIAFKDRFGAEGSHVA